MKLFACLSAARTVGGGMVTFERNAERAAANSAPKTFPASNSNDAAAEPLKAVDVEQHNASEGD